MEGIYYSPVDRLGRRRKPVDGGKIRNPNAGHSSPSVRSMLSDPSTCRCLSARRYNRPDRVFFILPLLM